MRTRHLLCIAAPIGAPLGAVVQTHEVLPGNRTLTEATI